MRYYFGAYVLDTLCYELQRAGVPRALRPKAFAVLAYLLAHRDRVVTKEELLEQVWPGQFVEEATLASCIMEVRKALGDSGPTPRLVQTVRRRGYRFVAPVQEEAPVSPSPAGPGGGPPRPPEALRTASPLAPPAPECTLPAPVPVPHHATPAAERRSLTVLWCALVDPLTSHRDLEDVQALVRTFHTACAEIIHGLEGVIGQYLSDAVVAYFGYPQAHDDDPQRSIRAGLRLLDALRQRAAAFAAGPCTVRVGIHTGPALVGALGGDRQALLALGETPALAARLQELAPLGSVVISAATARLVEGYFPWQELALAPLSAPDALRPAYQVLGDSAVQTRLEVVPARVLTPFVGRDVERTVLRERWAQATDGWGQVVVLSGEPGIGKSRLIQVLHEQLAAEPHLRWEWRCSPYYQHSAWHPVLAQLHRLLQWHHNTTPEARVRALEEMLTAAGLALPEVVPLLAVVLALPLPAHYAPLTLTPQQQKQQTLGALCTWVLTEARRQPVLLIVEDLHWSDPSTLELLTLLIDHGPTARMLTLLACRPEFEPPWTPRAHVTHLTLGRLSRSQVEDMIGQRTRGKPLPPAVVAQIVAKTDGVPLFVEELTTMVLESGLLQEGPDGYELTGTLPALAIPATLHGTLLARLDRLQPGKIVAQVGAIIGRTFAYELLQAIAPLDEATMQHGLRQLVEAELIYQQGRPPQATYMFKHALIREAAYESVLRSTCQQYHQRIALVLAEHFPETAESQPELLAYHCARGGVWARALAYFCQAAEKATQAFATREAVALYDQALEAASHLGQAADVQTVMAIYQAKASLYFILSDFPRSRAEGERLLALARQAGNREREAIALADMGMASARGHDFDRALAEAHQAIAIAREIETKPILGRGHFTTGLVHAVTGHLDIARQEIDLAITISQSAGDVVHQSYALTYAGQLKNWRGEYAEAVPLQAEALRIAREHTLLVPLLSGFFNSGLALVGKGDYDEALARFEEGLILSEKVGNDTNRHRLLNSLGWLAIECGDLERAIGLNRQGAEGARKRNDHETLANAELNLGDAFLAQGDLTLAHEFLDGVYRLVHHPATSDWLKWRYSMHLFASLGDFWLARGDTAKAQEFAAQCLDIATRTTSRKYLVKGWRLQGEIALACRQRDEAHGWLHQALTLAQTIGNPTQLWKTHLALGHLHAAARRPEQARQAYQVARAVIEQVKAHLRNAELRAGLEKSSLIHHVYALSACD